MRRRWPAAVGVGVALVLAGIWIALLVSPPKPMADGLAVAGDDPFGSSAVLGGDVLDAGFSPNARHLLVRQENGLALARQGKIVPLGPRTTSIAAAAWFPNSANVLVAEGPARTGQLTVLDLQGKSAGIVKLEPDVTFGTGAALAVLPGGRRAVAVTSERDPLNGSEQRRLTSIDLATGKTTPIESSEPGPPLLPIGGEQIALTMDGEECAGRIDLSGPGLCVLPGRLIGISRSRFYAVTEGAVWTSGTSGQGRARLTGVIERDGLTILGLGPGGRSVLLRDKTGLRLRPIPDPPVTPPD